MLEIHRASRARRRGPRRDARRTARARAHGGRRRLRHLGPRMDAERCAAFVRSVPGHRAAGPEHVERRGAAHVRRRRGHYFREHGVQVAVTGWTLTALLSTRLAGIPLVTEHAGSFLPPVFERGLLPLPATVGMPLERWLPGATAAADVQRAASPPRRSTPPVSIASPPSSASRASRASRRSCSAISRSSPTCQRCSASARASRRLDPARPEPLPTRARGCATRGRSTRSSPAPVPERVDRFLAGPAADRLRRHHVEHASARPRSRRGASRRSTPASWSPATVHDLPRPRGRARSLVERRSPEPRDAATRRPGGDRGRAGQRADGAGVGHPVPRHPAAAGAGCERRARRAAGCSPAAGASMPPRYRP